MLLLVSIAVIKQVTLMQGATNCLLLEAKLSQFIYSNISINLLVTIVRCVGQSDH